MGRAFERVSKYCFRWLQNQVRFAKSKHFSKTSVLKAPYLGFINPDTPTFGDISVLAKGKLKKNNDKTFSFEQVNDRCDEKCQINADKYLENVTALWMVERIRHREATGENHHFDLKFTVVPIYNDSKHQIDHNILENRLKNQMKKTFILRDSDYPNYFINSNRRGDYFSSGFERSMSSIMNFSPNNLMKSIFGGSPTPKQKLQKVDHRLNKGEYYMSPKIQNIAKTSFSPAVNIHAQQIDHRIRFPDSKEISTVMKPPMNLYRPKPEIYNQKNIIDYRGANDNVFVGTSDHRQTQTSFQTPPNIHALPNYQQNFPQGYNQLKPSFQQHQSHPIAVPVFSIPVDMPIIQLAQSPYAFPLQIQLSTPPNQAIFPPSDVTTFRYQPLIGLSNPSPPIFNPYLPISLLPAEDNLKPFKESERHVTNHYSLPDPVYHVEEQSTTEAPIQTSTKSPRVNNYASIVRQQVEKPVISTASSVQVNRFDDNEFIPISPPYDAKKFKNVLKTSSTEKPDSITSQLVGIYDDANATIPYVTLPPLDDTSVKSNEISYKVVADRPKSPSAKTSEKPVLKWMPKKQRNKTKNFTSTTLATPTQNSFLPTMLPVETTTQQSLKSTTLIYRGRNRYNKRNSSLSANVRVATISPQTTKIARKKTASAVTISALSTPSPYPSSVFPAYITPQVTQEPITSQSFSTSVSLEVNGERIFSPTTTVGYELISAGVESIRTNNSNIKLFKASVVPEKFDDLTFSILNHAKVIDSDSKKGKKN
jgi:hypothetical protein